jgi:hypothetical protein
VSALSPNVRFTGNILFIGGLFLWGVTFFLFFWVFFLDRILVIDFVEAGFEFNKPSIGRKLVVPSRISIMVGLGIILLLNLLAVVKICYYQQGPLRQHI